MTESYFVWETIFSVTKYYNSKEVELFSFLNKRSFFNIIILT